jgi:myo-inositol-1(or 4)-monophosphatase
VTEIDLAVQQMILAHLARITPGYAVIAEEADSSRPDSNEPDLGQPTWILDPVDGTTNLIRNFRHSAVSLALAEQGRLSLAFIFNPYTDELYTAAAGRGARINGTPIYVSGRADLADCLIGFGTAPYDRQNAAATFQLVERVFSHSLEVRRLGSAALDLAYVACGRLDGFFERTLQPWDYAAGSLIVQEAGGRVTDWKSASPSLRRGGSILASNGLIHESLLELGLDQVFPGPGGPAPKAYSW